MTKNKIRKSVLSFISVLAIVPFFAAQCNQPKTEENTLENKKEEVITQLNSQSFAKLSQEQKKWLY
ncbi:hypothetical protein [[Mycoplasma] gypis]|uniref:Lipoprotein n=1 Tax=[Mycoplasma] gypis TaxID=92404 RepID=A0ABZ2RQM6_9BACT|nr:hypothetical protein [[Mycoplasma] gypis]MBN0919575.1 hypothetical protein [[Mycoplasma] gypis]